MTERRLHTIGSLAGIAVLVAAFTSRPANAGPSAPDFASDRDARLERIALSLDLDAATLDQMRAISNALAEANAPRRAQIRRERVLLRSLLDEARPDEAAVMAQVDALSAVQAESWKARLRAMIEIRALLTPTQRKLLVAMPRSEPDGADSECQSDIRLLCPEVSGLRESTRCLIDNRDELSSRCRDSLSKGQLSRFFPAEPVP